MLHSDPFQCSVSPRTRVRFWLTPTAHTSSEVTAATACRLAASPSFGLATTDHPPHDRTTALLALGLATFMPFLLARCEIYEVSISCGYAFVMLALAAIWKALHELRHRGWCTSA